MSITKAQMLSFLNTALRREETDVDEFILMTLDDLSDMHVLKGSDNTLTLTALTTYLSYPSDALDDTQAVISVTLWDSSLNRLWPLDPMEGGWREYQRNMEGFSTDSRSQPTEYVCNDRKVYVWPPPNGDYTSELWYWKRHPQDVDSIVFPDSWRNCLKFGTAYWFAMSHKLADYIALWGTQYEREKQKRRCLASDGTAIVGG